MILQALVEHYEDLAAQGKLARPGWSDANISYALYINDDGELEQAVSLKQEADRGKKKVLVPRPMSLPTPRRKSSDITANFLWDDSSYILGVSEKGDPLRNLDCFKVSKQFHHQLLNDVDSPASRALLAFFDRWDPTQVKEHPALADKLGDILAGANLVFRYGGAFLQDDPLIWTAWQHYYDAAKDGPEMVCLVTGKKGAIAKIHPSILGVGGTNPKLVSFDKDSPAFCSYGKSQGYNAPTSEYAAFAYASALKDLLKDREYVRKIGETTVLFWAEGGQRDYQTVSVASLLGIPEDYLFSDLQDIVLKICSGKPIYFDETRLNPKTNFYVLGLFPNKGRLSVRFFLKNSFGEFVNNITEHYKRLQITQTSKDRFNTIYIPTLLNEVVNQKSSNKLYDKLLGETLRAVLTNTQYPATLRNFAYLRIRADRDINRVQASILKANLCKKYELSPENPIMEALQMDLNENCTYPPYLLGRLFSVMEQIQLASADWSLKRTIKDSYFTSVSATPKNVFAKLFPLNEYHMKKLKRDKFNLARNLENEKNAIISMLNAPIPIHFTPDEVDCFYIGYYHQNCKKENAKKQKEETEHV